MLIAGIVGLLGDTGCQVYERFISLSANEKLSLDEMSIELTRAKNVIIYRVIQAPLVDLIWLRFDKWYMHLPPALSIIAKVLSDQALLMPPSVVTFFVSQGLLEGRSFDDTVHRVKNNSFSTMQNALPFWLSVHTVTFGVLPPYARIAWASAAAIFWNGFMSSVNQAAIRDSELNNTAN